MRIAQISTLARTVPPDGEGSVEMLVHSICEGLVRRGHDVTLYAAEGSTTTARLQAPSGASYTVDSSKWDWQLYEGWNVRKAFGNWKEYDVIHCHSYHHGLLHCDWVPIPSVHSLHVEPGPDYRFLAERTRNRQLLFCSEWQARPFAGLEGVSVIHHGVDETALKSVRPEEVGSHAVWMGRFMEDKGPVEAIQAAREAGVELRMAGPESVYFKEVIKPMLGQGVEYVGEVKGEEKRRFLATAKAMLYPINRPEPFGLVVIEAMLCGTPVIAPAKGAVRELIEDGVTGRLCGSTERIAQALNEVDVLNRTQVRESAVEKFSRNRMVDRLENLYRELVQSP